MEQKDDVDLEALSKLLEPFPESWLSKLPKPTKKDNPKGSCPDCGGWHGLPAIHIDYVGHADLTAKFLEIDPLWNWEPFAYDERGLPMIDKSGSEWNLWIRLTIAGMTRIGVGNVSANEHDAMKQLIGDALRNAGMRFGAALDLWSKSERVEAQIADQKAAATLDEKAQEKGWGSHADWRDHVAALTSAIKDLTPEQQQAMRDKRTEIGGEWPPSFEEYQVLNDYLTELGSTEPPEPAPGVETVGKMMESHFPGAVDVTPKPAPKEKVDALKNYLAVLTANNETASRKAYTTYVKRMGWPVNMDEMTEEQVDLAINFVETL